MSDDPSTATPTDRLTIATSDGLDLQAELATPEEVTAAVVVCHPHPLHGGSMYDNVVSTLFSALPRSGAAVLRFNFRGTGGSEGNHDHGQGERLDVVAAVEALQQRHPGLPVMLAGYSFGADLALAVDHDAVACWFAVAPPMRVIPREDFVALGDQRPKHLVAAAHDQFRSPVELAEVVGEAPNTTITVIEGADHFFAVGLHAIAAAAETALTRVVEP